MALKDRIRQRREDLGLSQEELAQRVGVSLGMVSRWERTGAEPKASYVAALAEALGVGADWLLGTSATEAPKAPDPPHWQEFLGRYEHIGDLSPTELADIRSFGARRLRVRSWTDWERIAEIVRTSRPSEIFESKKR